MSKTLKTLSPIDGSVYVERPLAEPAAIDGALDAACAAQAEWARVAVAERAAVCTRFVDAFVARADELVPELAWQMGRPVSAGHGEIRGFEERARYMIDIAPRALADIDPGPKEGFRRWISREPLGVVFVIPAWNFPYMIAVNSVVPAIMAGNAVVLKHSSQTPLCAERMGECFEQAGLPAGLYRALHMDHDAAARTIRDSRVGYVAFTGSVRGGHSVMEAAASRFVGTGLELGGKDPAYVRPDVDMDNAVAGLVDGANFNSGQSCCSIERIYVHRDVYDEFVEGFVAQTRQYRLGNPLDEDVNLGPMVRPSAADFVRGQVDAAVQAGARALIDPRQFPADRPGSAYLAPQVLVDVNHGMRVMTEESFGPVCGIMRVSSDDEAAALMNDSDYGLTASVWTRDSDAAIAIGSRVSTGTWFMNRCDYLDPALAWVGVNDSGRGCTLSEVGYEHLTRPKSWHLKIDT